MIESVYYLSILLIIYSYVGYPAILYFWKFFIPKRKTYDLSGNLPTISILISAHNEEAVISEKLKNFAQMEYPSERMEILIGSDGSDDSTIQIISSSKIGNLRFFDYKERRGKPSVLNDLAKEANHDILLFSDANTIFSPDALRKLIEPFADNTIGGVIGNLSFRSNGIDNPGGIGEILYFKYENFIKNLEGLIYSTIVANGSVYAIRRELYKPIPVNKLISDDLFIPLGILKQGYRLIFREDAKVIENPSLNMRDEFRKKVRVVACGMEALRHFSSLLHPKYGFISFALWSHKVVRWMIPVLLVIAYSANIFLFSKSSYFGLLFILQTIFYILAIFGKYFEKLGIKFTPIRLSYYFIVVNLAIISGFKRFLKGAHGSTWERSGRI